MLILGVGGKIGMVRISRSIEETKKLAAGLARKAAKSKLLRHALVFALEGELGAGKTTFIQGFARALIKGQRITSPTFVLLKRYKLRAENYKFLYHIDAYRLRDYKDLIPLGIEEIITDSANIVLIEWAERVRPILPKKHVKIHIDHLEKNTRRVTVTSPKSLFQ